MTLSRRMRVRAAGFRAGVRRMLDAAAPILIWGFVTGLALFQYGFSALQSLTMNAVVYAASAETGVLPLVAQCAPVLVIALTGAAVNLRFVIFSLVMHPYFRKLPLFRKLFFSWLVCDVVFVWFVEKFADTKKKGTDYQLGYFLGLAAVNFFGTQLGGALGILLGTQIPASWHLDFAAVLAVAAILVSSCTSMPAVVGAAAAAAVSTALHFLPLQLGLLAGLIAGLAAALIADEIQERRKRRAAG